MVSYVDDSTPWGLTEASLCRAHLMKSLGQLLGRVGLAVFLLLAPTPRLVSHDMGIWKTVSLTVLEM